MLSLPTLLPGQTDSGYPDPRQSSDSTNIIIPQPDNSTREPLKPYTLPQSPEAGPRLGLADLERMALEGNPTLAQAAAEIKAAEGKKLQAGALPEPCDRSYRR